MKIPTRFRLYVLCGLSLAPAGLLQGVPTPTHHYAFEDDVTDSVGGAHGTLNNTVPDPYVLGTVGAKAIQLDGTDDSVALPVFYNSTGNTAVSVSAWIRTIDSTNQIIASADRSEYWRLEIDGSGGGPGQVGWDVATNNGIVDHGSITRVDDGEWHHVVGTFDGTTGAMRIYIDGYLDSEVVDPLNTSFGTGLTRYTFIGTGSEATVFNGPATPADIFNGDIDDLMIFNGTALTPQDVQELCLVGRGRVNLLDLPLTSYSSLTDTGVANLTLNGNGVADGDGITFTGPVSKKVPWEYSVTPNTILEFELDHSNAGLIAVGLDEDDDHTQLVADGTTPSPRLVAFHGLASPTADILVSPHQYGGTGFQRIQVCLGRYFQGPMTNLTFHTDTAGATATIRAIHIFEADNYDAWALELPIGLRGPNDDADNDGEENLLEYALGAPPVEAVTAECASPSVELTMTPTELEYRLPHTQKPDVVYVVQTSPDLLTWTAVDLRFKTNPWEELPGAANQTLAPYLLGAQVNLDSTVPGARFVRAEVFLYGDAIDLDGDQIDDHWEYQNELDPTDAADAALDPDGDFLTNLQEFQNGGSPFTFDPAVVTLELIAADAYELDGTPAQLRIKRAGSDEDATVFYTITPGGIPNYGTPGNPADYQSKIDGAATTGAIFMGDGEFEKIIDFEPAVDGLNEYPEGIRTTLDVPPAGEPYTLGATIEQDVFICDASSDPANDTLFVGFYRPELTSATSADGIATVRLDGRKEHALVTSTFGVMQTSQSASHVHSADPIDPNGIRGPIIESLPLGQIGTTPHPWHVIPAQGWTGQDLVSALYLTPTPGGPPHLYTNVHSGEYPAGEIWAKLAPASGAVSLSQEDIDRYENPQGIDLVDNTTGNPPADGLDDTTGQPLKIDSFGNLGFEDLQVDTTPASTDQEFADASDELKRDVVRFLQQATMGPRPAEVNALYKDIVVNHAGNRVAGYEAWITAQLGLAQTSLRELGWYLDEQEFEHRGDVDADNDGNITSRNTPDQGDQPFGGNFRRAWWTQTMQCHDQLLQRYILALSEIVVVSTNDATLNARTVAMGNYWDMIGRAIKGEIDSIDPATGDVFTKNVNGTYRDLLEAVSKSPVMGIYLSHLKNELAQDLDGDMIIDVHPDENYAREIMQLFSFGLVKLLQDGKIQLDSNGLPIATYTNDDIKELARVFTGWSFSYYHRGAGAAIPREIIKNNNFTRNNGSQYFTATYEFPMKNFGAFHDPGEKNFLGATVNAGPGSNDGEDDIQETLDIIHGHPTTAPFISVRLIKRLTSANPSAGYVYRVTKVFEDNGGGVRGDLQAVLRAILLDPEARDLSLGDNSISAGKVKEPLVAFGQIVRGFRCRSYIPLHSDFIFDGAKGDGTLMQFTFPAITNVPDTLNFNPNPYNQLGHFDSDATLLRFGNLEDDIGQDPMRSPTVFNWFLPDYSPGGALASGGLTSPELQIATETSVVELINEIDLLVRNIYGSPGARLVGDRSPGQEPNATRYDRIRLDDDHLNLVDANPHDRDLLEQIWIDTYNATVGSTQEKRTAAATALVEWLDLYFCAGRLKAQYGTAPAPNPLTEIIDAVDSQSGWNVDPIVNGSGVSSTGREMIRSALYLVLTSPDFLIQN